MNTLPLTEAALKLSCSREHLMRLARRGEVQGAKVGREWVFTDEALAELLHKKTVIKTKPAKKGRRRNEVPRI